MRWMPHFGCRSSGFCPGPSLAIRRKNADRVANRIQNAGLIRGQEHPSPLAGGTHSRLISYCGSSLLVRFWQPDFRTREGRPLRIGRQPTDLQPKFRSASQNNCFEVVGHSVGHLKFLSNVDMTFFFTHTKFQPNRSKHIGEINFFYMHFKRSSAPLH